MAEMTIQDQDLVNIQQDKDSALTYQGRRRPDWNDNYILYRDRIITNRLTQRQTINIPLMKYGLNTILKDNDDIPMLYFQNLDNMQEKEILFNEYWKKVADDNKLVVRDRIDKKQAILYGRTFKKLNITNGKFTFEIIDPQSILVERHVDPADLDTARCILHTKIFKTLREITENPLYDKKEIARMKSYFAEESTKEESEDTFNAVKESSQRLVDMGLSDALDPLVGTTYIELNEVYRKEFNEETNEECIVLYVISVTEGGTFKLFKKPLHKVIGKTKDDFWYDHFPLTSWSPDPESTDFWSDSPADILRQPNKVLNSWTSQLVENRTLKNFNMHYYDASNANFVPQTFTPDAWAWLPIPGKPDDIVKDVTVGDLSDSLEELQFIISVAEKAVAASSAQTGAVEQRQVTLGEVQLALANAQERTKSMGAYINEDWKDFGLKFIKMLEGADNLIDPVEVHKKGREGRKMYTKVIAPKDWVTKSGYSVDVRSKSDKQMEDENQLQKLNAAKTAMIGNQPLDEIYKRHMLEFAGLNAEEMKEVMDFEKQAQANLLLNGGMGGMGQPVMGQPAMQPAVQPAQPTPQPVTPAI